MAEQQPIAKKMNRKLKERLDTFSGPQSLAAQRPFLTALALSLGAAVSLGLTRFSYALLLPPMRADLGWSYFTAGAMNTANAAGYLVGALLAPVVEEMFFRGFLFVGRGSRGRRSGFRRGRQVG